MARIIAYCLDWHINQSKAFDELLVEPLRPFVDIELVAWDGRSGDPLGNWEQRVLNDPLIFCQRPPSPELLKISGAKLIWIPMWDNVALNWMSDEWWASLPKSLRVVAFSEKVALKSQDAGLKTLRLRYCKDPAGFAPIQWKDGRVLFYWNRAGLYGPTFLEKLCNILDVRELHFRGTIDPKISSSLSYSLPARIGKTAVHQVPRFDTQADYFKLLKRCNIYLAPRALEGVGLTFLEAMASGCAVLGYDAPTMNEYITHGLDGYLFPAESLGRNENSPSQAVRNKIRKWIKGTSAVHPPIVSSAQDWRALECLDLETLGHSARRKLEDGFLVWKSRIQDYAAFVMDW